MASTIDTAATSVTMATPPASSSRMSMAVMMISPRYGSAARGDGAQFRSQVGRQGFVIAR
jgi:hypothetical protein